MSALRIIAKTLLALILVVLAAAVLVLLFLFLYPSVGQVPDKTEPDSGSDHWADGQFRNENDARTMTGDSAPGSNRKIPKTTLPAEAPSFLTEAQESDLTFTWIGHSSFLLQMGNRNILVDPILSMRSSPVGFAGPKRFSELPVTAEGLPDIDVLFLSHDHYDHTDYRTILALKDRVGAFVVPLGVDTILTGWGVDAERVHPLDWWESVELDGVTFTLTPSQHFTGRNPLKGNRTLWGGVYLDSGIHRVYYTGDGGYYDVFRTVREKLGAPDLMIAECGQYDAAWAKVHMFPEQTVQAGLDAEAALGLVVAHEQVDAERHVLAELEIGDALPGHGGHGVLSGDLADVLDHGLQHLGVVLAVAAADADDHLVQAGDLHDALVLELLHQSGSDFLIILFLHSCNVLSHNDDSLSSLRNWRRTSCRRGSSCRRQRRDPRGWACRTWGRPA